MVTYKKTNLSKKKLHASHRQQYRSIRANPNERVNDVTSPAGRDLQLAVYVCCALNLLLYSVDHADLSLACIQPRLCWGRERGVFDPSSACLFQTSIGFWRERGVYCRLHSQSTADTVPPPSLPVLCFVDRRNKAAEAAGRSRRALAIPPPFPEQKEKNSFHEWHNGGGVCANPKTTMEVTNPVVCVDLHAAAAGWRAARHQAACMFEGQGSQHHVGFFGLLLTGVNK